MNFRTTIGYVIFSGSFLGFTLSACAKPVGPDRELRSVTQAPFGLHVISKSLKGPKEIGGTWTRNLVLWKQVELEPGVFRGIEKVVARINQLNEAGFEILPRIVSVNPWANTPRINELNKKAAANHEPMGNWTYIGTPKDLPAYKKFLTRLVESFDGDGHKDAPGLKGGIKYWQIENEWDWRWQDSPEAFVEFLRVAYETIKAADSNAKVVLGGLSKLAPDVFYSGMLGPSITYKGKRVTTADLGRKPAFKKQYRLRRYVLEKGHPYFDVISFHQYGRPWAIGKAMEYLERVMKAAKYTKPVWMTEVGGPFIDKGETYTPDLQAREVIKYYVSAMASGVEVVFWSTYLPTPEWGASFANTSLVDEKEKRKPAFNAYKLMTEKLRDVIGVISLLDKKNATVVRFDHSSGKKIIVLWWDEGPMDVALEKEFKAKKIRMTRYNGKSQTLQFPGAKVDRLRGIGPVFLEAVR